MTDRAPERLAAGVAALVVAAAVVLAFPPDRDTARGRAFQSLVGGLGWGTATSLADCATSFDPSVSSDCVRGLEPVPGGFAFCPHHSGPTIR